MTASTVGPARHVLADWLKLHELSAAQCLGILQAWPEPQPPHKPQPNRGQTSGLSADVVWDMAAAAMSAVFGRESAHLENVRLQTRCDFQPDPQKYQRAFTLNDGGQGAPVVVCNYRGFVSDIMVLAHEFGHASQIMACGAGFVPPVPREICAFLAELAMLDYLQVHVPEIHCSAQQVWQAACVKTWAKDRHDLRQFLSDPSGLDLPYSYQWNYPVARALALKLWGNFAANQTAAQALWPLFEGGMTAAELSGFEHS